MPQQLVQLTPLDVLLALEAIDADAAGEKTRRKLDVVTTYGLAIHDTVEAATLQACRQAGMPLNQ